MKKSICTTSPAPCSRSGFTLVELAIVLMIIGLLIAGILRGQEMMNNARLQNIVKQVTSYSAAMTTFRDSYSAMPGDMSNATARIPGCTTANNCRNGDGNGIMGTPNLVWILGDQSLNSEGAQFWKHMMLTHLITGVNPSASFLSFGVSHPSVPIGGGFTITTSLQDPGDPSGSQVTGTLVLRLHKDLTSNIVDESPAVTPQQASYIDRKMDDGKPGSGDVQSVAAGAVGAEQADCEGFGPGMDYRATSERVICTMSFVLNR